MIIDNFATIHWSLGTQTSYSKVAGTLLYVQSAIIKVVPTLSASSNSFVCGTGGWVGVQQSALKQHKWLFWWGRVFCGTSEAIT